MKRRDLEIICCPGCRGGLRIVECTPLDGEIESGLLECVACQANYPIRGHVPRFVPATSYADSFGLQWNAFGKTQLDSYSGLPISRERFLAETKWTTEELRGKLVLDVGCGAGRFSEIALQAGARLVSMDFSSAIDACFANLGPHENLLAVQGTIYSLPVKFDAFDFVYCLGVLQHTPDPKAAMLALVPPLRSGGRLAFDVYPKFPLNALWPKYWLRPLTKRLSPARLFGVVKRLVPFLLPFSRVLASVPMAGKRLRYLVPVMSYYGVFPFTARQHREWALLDTFDMLSPAYDQPQTAETIHTWLENSGLSRFEAVLEGLVVGRGLK